jgi:glycosyltransferase involved in cell wall biosynthesis
LRVVHVCAYFAPAFVYGGPPRSLLELCQAQRAAGLHVSVVTTTADGSRELPREATAAREYAGIPVTYCPRAWPRWMFHAPALGAEVERQAAAADVIHVHGVFNAAVWAAQAAARRAGRRYVLSPRGMMQASALAHDRWRKRASYVLFDRQVLRHAAVLHATSEAEHATLRHRFPRHEVVLIPNGVRPPAAPGDADIRRRLGLPDAAPLVTFLGRLHPLKRLDLLVAAFRQLRDRHPSAHLVVAGPDETGLRAGLEHQLQEAGAASSWTGPVDQEVAQSLLWASAALVLCSDSESFGLSVAEAMACGTPVVVTDNLGWREVASAGAGLVVPQRADAIAAALSTILADRNVARTMGEAGRALARDLYGWEPVVDALSDVYGRVAAVRA